MMIDIIWGRVYILGLDRFALWPWILWEISSFPERSSCMSFDMTDRLPAESIIAVFGG